MPGIIFRYISKNLAIFFLGILFVFVFVVFMGQFSQIFTYAMNYGADVFWVFSTMLYMVPDILVLSVPMALQIAILMTLTSMGQTGEIMALRAAGFSFMEIARPVLIFALLLVAVMTGLNGWLSPLGRHHVEQSKEDIASKISKVNIEPRTFIDLGDWDLFAEDVDKDNNIIYQVHLSRKNDDSALSTKVNASRGKVDIGSQGIRLTLFKGQMQRVYSLESRKIITSEFNKYEVYIPLSQKSTDDRRLKAAELTTPALIKAVRQGKDSMEEKEWREYRPAISYRISMALCPLIFFLLSCPVAFITTKKAGRAGAMIYSLAFIFAYFGLITIGNSVAEKTDITFLVYSAPFLPVIAGLAAGVYLWKKRLSD